jgi:DNA processing protein
MGAAQLTDEQRIDWLRLIRSESVGPRTFRALVNQFGGAGAALEALPDLARRSGRSALKVTPRADAEREIAAAARLGARFVAMGEPEYPRTLQAVDTAPPLIAVRGSVALLARPAVAIVGSRNASAAGLAFTERLARGLGQGGYAVVSGLARGIDTRAHRASIESGTVAVLAGGHDRVYPSENEPLLQAILDGGRRRRLRDAAGLGAARTGLPPPQPIVSGLSYGVVVVEAARRSGSLITARFALEQGREVFAVPGSPLDPRAEGTNDLIREGATLCAALEHVTAVVDPLVASGTRPAAGAQEPQPTSTEPLWDELDFVGAAPVAIAGIPIFHETEEGAADAPATDDGALVRLLGPSPVSVDELVRQSGLAARVVTMQLLELELAGRLERHGGNAVSLIDGR